MSNEIENNNNNIDKIEFKKKTSNNSFLKDNVQLKIKKHRKILSTNNANINIIDNENDKIPKKKFSIINTFSKVKTPKNIKIEYNNSEIINTTKSCEGKTIKFSTFSNLSKIISQNNNSPTNSPKKNLINKTYYCINSIDPLSIPEEDKIFNLFQLYKRPKKNNKKIQIKIKPKSQKKKIVVNSYINRILNNVYKEDENIMTDIRKIKQKKKKINLRKYQEKLLNIVSPTLTKDARKKLGKSFYALRKKNPILFKSDYFYMKDIEEQEKNIIKRVNNVEKKYLKLISKEGNNEGIYGITLKLPKIKFRKIIKPDRFSLSPEY